MNVKWKNVLITGGTAWIGYGIAESFAEKWANVIISYAHNEIGALEAVDKLKQYNVDVHTIKANSWDKKERILLQNSCSAIWKIDILVNNIWKASPDKDDNMSSWEAMFNYHLISTVEMTERLAKQMWEWNGGCVVNISSVAWTEPLSWHKVSRLEAYCCIKSAIETYTRISANKYVWSLRVNAVSPWNVETPGRNNAPEDMVKARMKWTLIHRFIQPKEIWSTVLHLVENDAINGHVFVVDGWVVAKGYE